MYKDPASLYVHREFSFVNAGCLQTCCFLLAECAPSTGVLESTEISLIHPLFKWEEEGGCTCHHGCSKTYCNHIWWLHKSPWCCNISMTSAFQTSFSTFGGGFKMEEQVCSCLLHVQETRPRKGLRPAPVLVWRNVPLLAVGEWFMLKY